MSALVVVVVVVGTLVMGVLLMVPDPGLRWLSQSVIAVAAVVSNMFFWVKTSGYFGGGRRVTSTSEYVVNPVEEQLYIARPWSIR